MKLSTTSRHGAALAVATLALTGAIGATATTTAAPASAADTSIRVITHNLAKKNSALRGVVRKKEQLKGPEVILLQEVCSTMLPRMRRNLSPTVVFHTRRSTEKCGTGGTVGEAVVWTGTGSVPVADVALGPEKDKHTYGLACVDFPRNGRSVRACSTHLVAAKAPQSYRNELTSAMATQLGQWVGEKDVVIVGGDFNTTPKTYPMDQLYGRGNDAKGKFVELHQMATGKPERDGKATIGGGTDARKFDYVFASMKGARLSGGTETTCWKDGNPDTTDCTTSNHRILWGNVPLKPLS